VGHLFHGSHRHGTLNHTAKTTDGDQLMADIFNDPLPFINGPKRRLHNISLSTLVRGFLFGLSS
jgi:hypothetical protein